MDMEPEVLDAYRAIGKDVVAINSFSSLVPEVFYFGEGYQQLLAAYFKQRQELALAPGSLEIMPAAQEENAALAAKLRSNAEEQICHRLASVEKHMQQEGKHFASLDSLFTSADSTS